MITSREEKMRDIQEEINREEERKKRNKIIKKTIKIVAVLLIIIVLMYFYITRISTHSIIVKEKRVESKDIPENFDSYKIVYFSDLNYDGNRKDLDNLVKIINERRPNLLIYTGRLIKGKISNSEKEYLIKKLNEIEAVSGKFALYRDDNEKSILIQSSFGILDNDVREIYYNTGSPILLVGIDDIEKSSEILDKFNDTGFKIMILENPDDADNAYYKASMMLAGKSLNGEICLVPDACLYKVDGAKKYYKQYYTVHDIPFYISGGIGTDKYSVRFNSRPMIYFFRLSRKN